MPKPSKPDPLIGATLGRYTIESRLGAGGMGAVYRAKEAGILGRTVALKVLPARLAEVSEFVERFSREAQRAAELRHGNVVQVYDADQADGHYFMAMQLMDGGSLADLIARHGALDPLVAARIVRDAAQGLACAHKAGIVHRDIKPANIFLDDHGARLGDFGLVKALDGDDQPLTQTGMILGTPHYMAPEQCEGETDIDHRADLYALGLVLYHALSGKIPAKGSTPLQIIRYRCTEDPEPLRSLRPSIPAALTTLVDELLVRERAGRLSDAAELARRLDHFMGDVSGDAATLSTPVNPATRVAPSVVAAGGAVTGSHGGQPDPSSIETIDLPASGGQDAPPPPPPPPSSPPAAPTVADTAPVEPGSTTAAIPDKSPATVANSTPRAGPLPQGPPSSLTQARGSSGKVLLYTCLSLFLGFVVLPVGCIAVLHALSNADVALTEGESTNLIAGLDPFFERLEEAGNLPFVTVRLTSDRFDEVSQKVEMRVSGTLEGSGLQLDIGPFTEASGIDVGFYFHAVLARYGDTFRTERAWLSHPDHNERAPEMTIVGTQLAGSPHALELKGNWSVSSHRGMIDVYVRIGESAPTETPDSKTAQGTRISSADEAALRNLLTESADKDPLDGGEFLLQAWLGTPLVLLSDGGSQRESLLLGSVTPRGPHLLELKVEGLDPYGPASCDTLILTLQVHGSEGDLVLTGRDMRTLRSGVQVMQSAVGLDPMPDPATGAPSLYVVVDSGDLGGDLILALDYGDGGK